MQEIKETLPQLSKIGSKDDMSLSMIYNDQVLPGLYPALIEWQIQNLERRIEELDIRIADSRKIITSLKSLSQPSQQNLIELQYAQKDHERAIEEKRKLEDRKAILRIY